MIKSRIKNDSELDNRVKAADNYEFYGPLLKDKQKNIFEKYIYDDLGLSEIADIEGISRQSVYETVRRVEKTLEGYEEKLGLVKKFEEMQKMTDEIRHLVNHLDTDKGSETFKNILKLLEEIPEV